jgi:hypothetical protein
MPFTFPTLTGKTGKRILFGGGSLVLGGGCLVLLFKAGVGFLLLWLAVGSRTTNDAPANQLTVVQGTVTNAETNEPIPGMLLVVRSQEGSSSDNSTPATDSVRTDARGKYRMSFRNQKGFYYAVSVDYPPATRSSPPARYWFADPNYSANNRGLKLGRLNTCDFRPGELHTIAVRVHNRNTGYRFLQMPDGSELPISDRDTTVHLLLYALPATGIKLNYLKDSGSESEEGDTAVALVLQNPAARFPDTVRATLTFVR